MPRRKTRNRKTQERRTAEYKAAPRETSTGFGWPGIDAAAALSAAGAANEAETDESARGRLIGYARVSTLDQKLNMQLDALARAGCEDVFKDHGVCGADAQRPGLNAMLEVLRAGDVLVVYRLDRLGRSVQHLSDLLTRFDNADIGFCSLTEGINTTTSGGKLVFHVFAAVAQFYRDLIRENTLCGLQAARERGQLLGRPPLLDIDQVLEVHRALAQGDRSVAECAMLLGVSRRTVTRSLDRHGLRDAA